MKRIYILILLAVMCSPTVSAREIYDICRGWKFYTFDKRDTVRIDLPHTWNDSDLTAGRNDYYRGTGNYMKSIRAAASWRGRRVFIKFYGGANVTDVLVNGRHAGQHRGSNNAFEFEITNLLDYDSQNLVWVMVNNGIRLDVLPTAEADNSYGGLFRKAEIIVTDQTAIGFDGYGGNGVMFMPSSVTAQSAKGKTSVAVNSRRPRNVTISVSIADDKGNAVWTGKVKHKAEEGVSTAQIPFEFANPHLWNGTADPYLYTVTVRLNDENYTDSVVFRTGMRSFAVDAANGFWLNGKQYPLHGVTLWRDQAVSGSVFSENDLLRDIEIIREMGVNAVRVAGGTHHPHFYELCDEYGIIVFSDGPLIGTASLDTRGYYNSQEFKNNGQYQLLESIHQHCNNPCVIAWSVFTEPEMIGDDPLGYVRQLNSAAKSADPTRLTVGVSSCDGDLNRITDLVVWNHSFGWLAGQPDDIVIWCRQLHSDPVWSRIKSAVCYRASGTASRYSESMHRPDSPSKRAPENWQTYVHTVHAQTLNNDKTFWAVFAGDMFDYGAINSPYGDRHGILETGLVSFDRKVRKDAFWYYKALWNQNDPFLHIASTKDPLRRNKTQNITVYSNLPSAELFRNGVSLGTQDCKNGTMVWSGVELTDGNNEFTVTAIVESEDNYMTIQDNAVLNYAPTSRL